MSPMTRCGLREVEGSVVDVFATAKSRTTWGAFFLLLGRQKIASTSPEESEQGAAAAAAGTRRTVSKAPLACVDALWIPSRDVNTGLCESPV